MINKTEVDIAAIIDDVLFSFSEIIKKKNIQLEYELEESILFMADEKLMETVIRNIIGNAIVHSSYGAKVKLSSSIVGEKTTS